MMVGKYSHASYGCAALSSIANSKSLTEVAGLVLGEVANMIASIGHLFFLLLFNSSIFVAQAVVDTQLTGTWSTKSLNVSTGPVSRLNKRGFWMRLKGLMVEIGVL
jgi:carbon starvation protein CstA